MIRVYDGFDSLPYRLRMNQVGILWHMDNQITDILISALWILDKLVWKAIGRQKTFIYI